MDSFGPSLFQARWFRSTALGPVIVLPTGVAFRLVSRALSWCMSANTIPTCVRSYYLDVGWTPHIIELLDVGGRSFVCPPQPQCFFQSEPLVLAEQVLLEVRVSGASNDQFQESLICRAGVAHSAGVNAHFSTCSLQRLTKSWSDSRGSWRYAINFSRAIGKFSAGSSCSLNLSMIAAGVC